MPVDKSLFFYGRIYHKLLDPHQAEARKVIAGLIPEGSSVLDIACGTGQLCLTLRAQKQCRVLGIGLSLRMLQFAEKSNHYDSVRFMHQDATDLSGFGDHTFDYSVVLILMHELPRQNHHCGLECSPAQKPERPWCAICRSNVWTRPSRLLYELLSHRWHHGSLGEFGFTNHDSASFCVLAQLPRDRHGFQEGIGRAFKVTEV